jgi:hypothetical protein
MIQVLVRIVVEGTKAAAPHVVRHAHHVIPAIAPHLVRHGASQVPNLVQAGGAGAAGVAGVGTARATHAAHHAARAAVAAKHASTAATVTHVTEDLAADAAAGEALHVGLKVAGKKLGGAQHEA